MNDMFSGASIFNGDISSWDVSNVNNMARMFIHFTSFNQDISSWDVSSVTTMRQMFKWAEFNQDISGWDVSSVTDMYEMFMFYEVEFLSDENKCAIHTSFSTNSAWPYDWS